MYLLRDNPVKAPNGAICRLATTSTAVCIAVAGAAVLLAGAATRTQCPALPSGASSPTIPCRYDAALTRLFTPRAAPDGTYRVYVTSAPLDKVAAQLRGSDTDGG